MGAPVSGGPPRVRAVLFDLGGTLVDERDFAGWVEVGRQLLLDLDPDRLVEAYRATELEVDLEASPERPADGGPVDHWRRVLSKATDRDVGATTAGRFLERLHALDHPMPVFSDVRRCLEELRSDRRALGVVSNSSSEARVRSILHRAGILDFFSRVVSSGSEGVAKPHPEIFRRAIARMDVAPREAIYVGNLARTDARGAQGAGLHGLWLNREGTGLGLDPPEISSLLLVPITVRRIEQEG